jgi:autotransporter-associated beta strand protein
LEVVANQILTFNGNISGTSRLDKTGAGTLMLGGAGQGFTGVLRLSAGTLELASGSVLGNAVIEQNGGMLKFGSLGATAENPVIVNMGGLSGAGGTLETSENVQLAVAVPSPTSVDEYDGNITGGGGLRKEGAGTLIMGGNNTFSGKADIDGGRLVVRQGGNFGGSISTVSSGAALVIDGTATSATIVVEGGGLLGGSGTVQSASTIFGTHSPGSSPGLQTFTNGLTYEGGSQVEWELFSNVSEGNEVAPNGVRGGTIGWDGVNVIGGDLAFLNPVTMSLVFNGTGSPASTVSWSNALWSSGNRRWLIYQVSGGGSISGFRNLSLATSDWRDSDDQALSSFGGSASNFFLTAEENAIYLNFNAIPEPGRAFLSLLGLLGIAWRRRRVPCK